MTGQGGGGRETAAALRNQTTDIHCRQTNPPTDDEYPTKSIPTHRGRAAPDIAVIAVHAQLSAPIVAPAVDLAKPCQRHGVSVSGGYRNDERLPHTPSLDAPRGQSTDSGVVVPAIHAAAAASATRRGRVAQLAEAIGAPGVQLAVGLDQKRMRGDSRPHVSIRIRTPDIGFINFLKKMAWRK